jgi:hypothetical protein
VTDQTTTQEPVLDEKGVTENPFTDFGRGPAYHDCMLTSGDGSGIPQVPVRFDYLLRVTYRNAVTGEKKHFAVTTSGEIEGDLAPFDAARILAGCWPEERHD